MTVAASLTSGTAVDVLVVRLREQLAAARAETATTRREVDLLGATIDTLRDALDATALRQALAAVTADRDAVRDENSRLVTGFTRLATNPSTIRKGSAWSVILNTPDPYPSVAWKDPL